MAIDSSKPLITICAFDKPGIIGGPVSWLLWLMPALIERGFRIRCLVYMHLGEGPLINFLDENGIEYSKTINPLTTEDSIRWTLEQLKAKPTDIFFPNVVTSAYYACRWIRKAGIATVGILHSDHAYCDGLQEEFVAGKKSHRLTGMVGVSRELEQQLTNCKTRDTSVYRIPYGAPVVDQFVAPPHGKFRIAFFGRLVTEQKRIQDLARAFCRTVKQLPSVEAIIYGDGPEKAEVAAILAKEGSGLSVYLGGAVPSQQVQDKMRESHVIVLLSDYEGLPIAIMEAMACGCVPVCRYNKSGIPELIEDGVNGFILDDAPDALPKAIQQLVNDPVLWQKFSNESRDKIRREYTKDIGADLWAETFRDQIKHWRRPGNISIPCWISLPAENDKLNNAGQREKLIATFLKRRIVRSRMFAGKIKRMFLHQSKQES
ncbi:glycosyltransferase family 4 protein [Cerasicoccus arenae]|uniref:Glycosyl transferase family 1 domain-containing protein n=1 Tax=Cerasicoccus arenae TaxID=424488 RepID=A0A8J3DH21_9BACT|nr:glycosyltransferase family 4 protein [Cerasicoccus arenae]MBK1857050.1 glycosyltransferase family 4 protein [Cerasicoccus arenae]GHB92070.1 hypothetical protein GCM10007047_03840 [Cerasicoccus arenae]